MYSSSHLSHILAGWEELRHKEEVQVKEARRHVRIIKSTVSLVLPEQLFKCGFWYEKVVPKTV